ncbi:MAG: exodeoxyribonuclease VII large subunit, partial [Oscillospiraceae bacterium]|nr:exodeoxyribonuclease VII large subunit [Oscillospiraceae bacterium]
MNDILTVSQINQYLKQTLDEDVQLKSIFIRGEISNFTHHLKSGHFYFTLKDAKSAIKAVMFKWNASQLRFKPSNGMSVIIFGSVQFYERDGVCQIYCTDMQPDGIGALYTAYEQLKAKLEGEGLFDPSHKKQLPAFPKRIGVITAKTGAALQDVINILSRRYPLGELVLIPALVQGEQAPASICTALKQAENAELDLLIVGRGGGSIEDLWAFNDERVARTVYACPIPVISAVGHETDYTICDFVADLRAPTPSAAAELAVPDCSVLWDEILG